MGKMRKTAGFSLLEAVILVTIMSIVAVAAGVGLQSIVRIPKAADSVLAINRQLASDLEQLKAGGWGDWRSGRRATT
jgi:type II secretory pathway pseudopilin PulG